MEKLILLYFPYELNSLESGSRVRPNKIIQGFRNLGYEIFLIKGNSITRKGLISKVIKENRKFLFCYSEPSTYPINPFVDYRMYFFLKRKNIPTGIFYRDAYWKFKYYFKKKGLKRIELLLRYRLDFYLFNSIASVIFFPTHSLRKIFNIKTSTALLPPAGEKLFSMEKVIHNNLRGVYVGAVSLRYGIEILLEAFEIINKEIRVELEIVCRKEEYELLDMLIKNKLKENWINLHHVSGEKLKKIYKRCDFGIIPRLKYNYNELVMPVKLFEYLSQGIPIIATDCFEMANFIKKNNCGIICKDNSESMANSIKRLVSNLSLYYELKNNAVKTIKNGNTWEDRVNKIVNILSKNN